MDQIDSVRKMIVQKRVSTGSICKMRDEQREARTNAGIDSRLGTGTDEEVHRNRVENRNAHELTQDPGTDSSDLSWEWLNNNGEAPEDYSRRRSLVQAEDEKRGIEAGMTAMNNDMNSGKALKQMLDFNKYVEDPDLQAKFDAMSPEEQAKFQSDLMDLKERLFNMSKVVNMGRDYERGAKFLDDNM